MSAVPKKKLCWNCEGNVSREIDNCPYCGVYLHAAEEEEDSNSRWNPSYRPSSKTEEIPSPIYQIQDLKSEEKHKEVEAASHSAFNFSTIMNQLKKDVFPLLFLMMGSVFLLFGAVLALFAQNGSLTLQWKGEDGLYFLLFAIPLLAFGWIFLQNIEGNDN